jgi:hypothetical protein
VSVPGAAGATEGAAMSKRDWASRKVRKVYYVEGLSDEEFPAEYITMVNLLKAERSRARRIVREVRKRYAHSIFADVACDEILTRLQ